ncbi:conserved hypothetical protein [Roseibium sp. TrichSKD4]|nr:hypothetical protein [Roseibium sp. TrichSKD4]EFO33801.1 conserved hypothetical protein [Roseibium sp. TrichSKD4]
MIEGFPDNECEFIGLILQSPPSIAAYQTRVPPEAFTNRLTRMIWEGMVRLS